MDRDRSFYICLFSGVVALVLLMVSVNLPSQLVFESRPYARVVLASGNIDNWSARQLNVDPAQFDMVKANYAKYLIKNKNKEEDSESEDSSDDEDDDHDDAKVEQHRDISNDNKDVANDEEDDVNDADEHDNDDNDNGVTKREVDLNSTNATKKQVDESSESSESSSDDDGDESSSDLESLTLEQRLQDMPLRMTIGFGLFNGRKCVIQQDFKEKCRSLLVYEGIYDMEHEVSFLQNELSMPMWNNLRVECLFSVISCGIGLACLLAALRPCCDNQKLPVYLGAIAFASSGILVFIPMVRLLMMSSDFRQNLDADMNITTCIKTPWSLVISGLASPFAFLASFLLIATKCNKETKKLYSVLKSKLDEENTTLNHRNEGILLNTLKNESKNSCEHDGSHYENIEEVKYTKTKTKRDGMEETEVPPKPTAGSV